MADRPLLVLFSSVARGGGDRKEGIPGQRREGFLLTPLGKLASFIAGPMSFPNSTQTSHSPREGCLLPEQILGLSSIVMYQLGWVGRL